MTDEPVTASAACDGCGFKVCPALGQPCCDQCSHDQQRPASDTQKQRAAALAVRVGAVKDELAALLVEVEREGPFFGSFHATNGLRQARTYTNDCLVRLMELAR